LKSDELDDVLRLDRQGKAMHIKVPQTAIGNLFGAGGENLRSLQEWSNCSIKVDSRTDTHGQAKLFRLAKICSRESAGPMQVAAMEQCARAVQLLCGGDAVQLSQAVSQAMAEQEAKEEDRKLAEEQEKALVKRAQEDEAISRVSAQCGDKFSEPCIREALDQENWDPNKAIDHLFNEYNQAERSSNTIKPAFKMSKLLEASRAANAARKAKEVAQVEEPSTFLDKMKREDTCAPSKDVLRIRNVVALAVAKGEKLKERKSKAMPPSTSVENNGPAATYARPIIRSRWER
jgi:hypothetical protein